MLSINVAGVKQNGNGNLLPAMALICVVSLVGWGGWVYHERTRPRPRNYVEEPSFDRKALVERVRGGDKDAAFELGMLYDRGGVPEAAYHWWSLAAKLGRRDLKPEFLEFYREGIPGHEILYPAKLLQEK